MFMILQMGTGIISSLETSLGLIPHQHSTCQHLLSYNTSASSPTSPSLPSTSSTAISHLPALTRKKLPIPPGTQKQNLHDFCQVSRKGMLPMCTLPSLDLLCTFQSEDGWDAATALLLKTLGKFYTCRSKEQIFHFKAGTVFIPFAS